MNVPQERSPKKAQKATGKRSSPVKSPGLPGIEERLSNLQPSKELLDYYRKKIADFDEEHEEMLKKLDKYAAITDRTNEMEHELRQRNDEISQLQNALSDLQVYLYQEREQVLRLYSENDRLKIQELEDRKKIELLLTLSGTTESELTYFAKQPPQQMLIPQKLPPRLQKLQDKTKSTKTSKRDAHLSSEDKSRDIETLNLHIAALQSQLEEQTRLSQDEIQSLMDDRRICSEEREAERQRTEGHIKYLTEKLQDSQDLLYDSTRDFLKLRGQQRLEERSWMAEKDRLLREVHRCKEELGVLAEPALVLGAVDPTQMKYDTLYPKQKFQSLHQRAKNEIEVLQGQLDQLTQMSDMYREQCLLLEEETSKLREQTDTARKMFKDRTQKMNQQVARLKQRYAEVEKRRLLEAEGFRNDIKILRNQLRYVEKQLYKASINVASNGIPEDLDLAMLATVYTTAGRAKEIQDELKNLKSKMYNLENELRHL